MLYFGKNLTITLICSVQGWGIRGKLFFPGFWGMNILQGSRGMVPCTAKYGPQGKKCTQYSKPLYFFFTFNSCSKCSGTTVNLKYSDLLYHLHFSIVLCMVNNCTWYSKPMYFRFTVFTCVFSVISLYIFAVWGTHWEC